MVSEAAMISMFVVNEYVASIAGFIDGNRTNGPPGSNHCLGDCGINQHGVG
jgi:hypothetical protein